MSTPQSDLTTTALFYATSLGFSVFPCREVTVDDDRRAKAPLTKNGCHEATTKPATITAWWKRWPQAAIGINCGRSGLVVVDCDTGKVLPPPWDTEPGVRDGEDVLTMRAERAGQPFPWTRSVRTPSGGVHYYYRPPTDGVPIPPSQGRIGPMVDVRASESYVIAAGSSADGKPYTVLDRQPIQPLPEWLAELARPPQRTNPIERPVFNGTGRDALKPLVAFVLDAQVGERNGSLYWAACRMREDIEAGRYGRDQGVGALAAAGRSVGLGDREAQVTITSALRRTTP